MSILEYIIDYDLLYYGGPDEGGGREEEVARGGISRARVIIISSSMIIIISSSVVAVAAVVVVVVVVVLVVLVVYCSNRLLGMCCGESRMILETDIFAIEKWPTSIVEVCGDDESVQKLRRTNALHHKHYAGGTKRAISQLLRPRKDLRTGSVSRDIVKFPSELCSRRSLRK